MARIRCRTLIQIRYGMSIAEQTGLPYCTEYGKEWP